MFQRTKLLIFVPVFLAVVGCKSYTVKNNPNCLPCLKSCVVHCIPSVERKPKP